MNDEPGRLLEAIEVADLALVTAFAKKLGSLAMRAGAWFELPGKLDMNCRSRRLAALKGVVPLQA